MNDWYFVGGAWSDALIAYHDIELDLQLSQVNSKPAKANIVFYGLDLDIRNFFKAQTCIDQVSSLLISNFDEYVKYLDLSRENFSAFLKLTGLGDEIPLLKSAYALRRSNSIASVRMPNINKDCLDFMESCGKFLVFHPFSCHSAYATDHWPFWMAALDWVLENFEIKVVLTGQLMSNTDHRFKFPWINHPKLINFVDQTKSMFDVLNLTRGAVGVVTTSGGLSCWSKVTQKPTMVVCNKTIKEKNPSKYAWIKNRHNLCFDYELTMDEFKSNFTEWIVANKLF
jgi:hypothetical protein